MRPTRTTLGLTSALVALAATGAYATQTTAPPVATPALPFMASGVLGALDTSANGSHTVVFDTSSGIYSLDGVARNDALHRVAFRLPRAVASAARRSSVWAFDFTTIRLAAATDVVVRGSDPLILLSPGSSTIAAPLYLDGTAGAAGGRGAGGGGGGGGGAVAIYANGTLSVTSVVSVRGGTGGLGDRGSRTAVRRAAYDGGAGGGGAVALGSNERVVLDGAVVTASGDAASAGPVSVVGPVTFGRSATVNGSSPMSAGVRLLPALPYDGSVLFGGAGGGGGGGSGLPPAGSAGYARTPSIGGLAGPGGGAGGVSGYAYAGGSGGAGGAAAALSGAGGGGGGGGGAYDGLAGTGGLGNGSGSNGADGSPGGTGKCNNGASGGGGGGGGNGSVGGNGGGAGGGGGAVNGWNGSGGSNGSTLGGGGGGGGGGGDACATSGSAPGTGGTGGSGGLGAAPGGAGTAGVVAPAPTKTKLAQEITPEGPLCGFVSVIDLTREDGWNTGAMYGGPYAGNGGNAALPASGTLTCSIDVNEGTHTGSGVSQSTSGNGVVTSLSQLNYPASEADAVYLCAKFRSDADFTTWYWDDANSEWSTSPSVPCALAISTE